MRYHRTCALARALYAILKKIPGFEPIVFFIVCAALLGVLINVFVKRSRKDALKATAEGYPRAAERIGADVQYRLAYMYYNGENVAQDYNKAVEWLSKAAKQGHIKAQFELGLHYESEKNYGKAVEWYSEAAELGYPPAIDKLKEFKKPPIQE